jgi:hypothetical protein
MEEGVRAVVVSASHAAGEAVAVAVTGEFQIHIARTVKRPGIQKN